MQDKASPSSKLKRKRSQPMDAAGPAVNESSSRHSSVNPRRPANLSPSVEDRQHHGSSDTPCSSSTIVSNAHNFIDLTEELTDASEHTNQETQDFPASNAPVQAARTLQHIKPEPRALSPEEILGLQQIRRLLVGVVFSDIQGLKALRENNFDAVDAANAIQDFLLRLEEAKTGDRVRLASENSQVQNEHGINSHSGPRRSILIRHVPSLESLLQQQQAIEKKVSREEDQMIARLHDMGFPDSTCRLAATHCHGNFEHAVEWALTAGAVGTDSDPIDLTDTVGQSAVLQKEMPQHYDAALELLELEGKALGGTT